jgi:hypothetical protein
MACKLAIDKARVAVTVPRANPRLRGYFMVGVSLGCTPNLRNIPDNAGMVTKNVTPLEERGAG